MLIARWLVGVVFAAFGVFVIVGNAVGVARATREHGYSSIPMVGGGSVAFALVALPIAALHRWWWLPLFVDVFSLPMVILAIVHHIRRRGD